MGNLIRRFFALLAVVILMIGVTALFAAPQVVVQVAQSLGDTPTGTRTLLIVAAIVIDLLLLAVAVRIIRPQNKEELMVRTRGATTKVSVDSVQRQINTRIAQISDVLHVHTDVEVTNGSASVELHVRTRPDIMIPEKQREIGRVLRQLVEKQMGLRLASDPLIHIALATDEFDTTDRVTAVMEPDTAQTYMPIAESAYTEVAPETRALPEPSASRPQAEAQEAERQPEEPWRAFLLEED